jgi:hypothetical protein
MKNMREETHTLQLIFARRQWKRKKKRFLTLTPGPNVVKLFISAIYERS